MDVITFIAVIGHKTMAVFTRYNTVDANDLRTAAQKIESAPATSDFWAHRKIAGSN